MFYIHNIEYYYRAIKRNSDTYLNMEAPWNVMLNLRSQKQKATYDSAWIY